MKKKIKKLLSATLCLILIASMLLATLSCGSSSDGNPIPTQMSEQTKDSIVSSIVESILDSGIVDSTTTDSIESDDVQSSDSSVGSDDSDITDDSTDGSSTMESGDEPYIPDDDFEEIEDKFSKIELFLYNLVRSDLLLEYDVFLGFVETEDQEIFGLVYTDYKEAYEDEDGVTYFSSGFVSTSGQTINTEDTLDCVKINSLEGKYDEEFTYVYSQYCEDVFGHCVYENNYIRYQIENGTLAYESKEFFVGMPVDDFRGNIYNYDTNEFVYIIDESDHVPVTGVSMIGEAEIQMIVDEINSLIKKQDLNFSYAEIESFVAESKDAVISYLLGQQEEMFLGVSVESLVEMARDIDPMEHIQIGVDENGNTTIDIIAVTKLATFWERAITAFICANAIVGGIACSIVAEFYPALKPILGPIGGASVAVGMEVFCQVVIDSTPVSDVQWSKVAVAAVSGAIAGLINGYTHGFCGELIDVLCDAVIGGGEYFANALIDGKSFSEATEGIGQAMLTAALISAGFKVGIGIGKVGVKLVKKAGSAIVEKISGKTVKKLTSKVGEEVVENASSEAGERAAKKSAKNGAEKVLNSSKNALQEKADDAARNYNKAKNVIEKARNKGLEGFTETSNNGIAFANSKYMHQIDGKDTIARVKATGNRAKDFAEANKLFGFADTPEGYVWHHVDDYNVETGELTLELVKVEAHKAIIPHAGGCAQYDAVWGPTYNPVRKGV